MSDCPENKNNILQMPNFDDYDYLSLKKASMKVWDTPQRGTQEWGLLEIPHLVPG